jgi:RNA polymerase sigma factor (sigma-70 family)
MPWCSGRGSGVEQHSAALAVEGLATLNPRLSRVVEYRFFGGLTEEEIAEATGVTVRTVRRDWAKARGWLYEELAADSRRE